MPATLVQKPSEMPPNEVISMVTEPVRWQILGRLDGQKSAKQIAEELKMKQANVQYHLKRLKAAGLVDEFPMPNFPRRYVYERRSVTGSISVTSKGLKADVVVR